MRGREAGRIGASSGAGAAYRDLRTAKQTLRPRDQHDRHHQKLGDQRQLGKIDGKPAEGDETDANAQRFDFGNEDGRNIRSDDRAHAADHHHDERIGDDRQIHAEIGRFARELQRAAETGQQCAEGKNGGEQYRLIYPERAEHLAVFGRGANQAAKARARKHDVEHAKHDRRDDHQKGVVARQLATEDFDGAAQARRARSEQILRSPQPQRRRR